MDRGLLSVIVPIYNVQDYLDECVQSIVNQTYQNLEIILVDDGSIDQSSAIADDWAKKDARVKTYHKSNGGLSSARNYGLERCAGEYIAFVDSDDYIVSNMYQKMIAQMNEKECDLSVCTCARLYEDGVVESIHENFIDVFETTDLSMQKMHSPFDCFTAWNKVYRRALIINLRYPLHVKFGEDLYLASDIWKNVTKAVYICEGLYIYRYRASSISFVTGSQKLQDRIEGSERYWQFVNQYAPNSVSFMLDLYFGAYVAAYFESKDKKTHFKKAYNDFFCSNIRHCFKKAKMILFFLSPYCFGKLKDNR